MEAMLSNIPHQLSQCEVIIIFLQIFTIYQYVLNFDHPASNRLMWSLALRSIS
jgi:hypothetical protein